MAATVAGERSMPPQTMSAGFPNPMYAAFVLVVPGLALLLDSWLVLIGPAVVYGLFRIFIRGEGRWLHAKFGRQYEEYRRRGW